MVCHLSSVQVGKFKPFGVVIVIMSIESKRLEGDHALVFLFILLGFP